MCAHGAICDLGECTSAGFDAGLPVESGSGPATDATVDALADATADTSPEGSNLAMDLDSAPESATINDSGEEGQ